MASPTPSFSCPPCGDTPLAIGGSVITFLTFISGLIAGLSYWYGLAKSSPVEIRKFIEELSGSLEEIHTLAVEMDNMSGYQPGIGFVLEQEEDEISHRTKTELNIVLRKLRDQLNSLHHLKDKVDRRDYYSSRSTRWFRRQGRLNYLIIRDELQQKVVEKDRLMTELRHIHQRALKIGSDRVERAHREEHHKMLESILHQFTSLDAREEHHKMLESILHQVTSLDARGRKPRSRSL